MDLDLIFNKFLRNLTVGQFEKATSIINSKELTTVEKYLDVMEYLGVPAAVIDEMSNEDFKKAVTILNSFEFERSLVPSIELEGYTYTANVVDGQLQLKARELALLEKEVQSGREFFAYTLAVLFKRTDLSSAEHYDKAHIKHKAKLFKEVLAGHYYMYVVELTKILAQNLQTAATTAPTNSETLEDDSQVS